MDNVVLNDHSFKIKITAAEIKTAVNDIAKQINKDLNGKTPLFIGVLDGSFMFVADLMKKITIDCDISFIKVESYHGMISTGKVKEVIAFNQHLIKNRTVVIVEDIVDTGNTIEYVHANLKKAGAGEVKIATLLFKAGTYTKSLPIDYTAIMAPNDFLVGYGLDYKGLGRNLKDIYVLDYIADEKLKEKKKKAIQPK